MKDNMKTALLLLPDTQNFFAINSLPDQNGFAFLTSRNTAFR